MNTQNPGLPPAPLFSVRQETGIHVITFVQPNALDAYNAEQLGERVYHHLKAFDAPRVVLDVHNLELLSSSALGVLISLNSLVEHDGGQFCLANVGSGFRQILKMTKTEGLFQIHESMAQALKSLA
ncbi:MAG: STAS domain-containing protein [Planctomycetota bacterium]|jgi:anti-anti-sigma factor